MTTTDLAIALGDTLCACAECDWTGQAHDLGPVFNIEDRIDAGGIVPAGECPICGELAFIVKEEPAPNEAEIMLAAIRARLQGEWDNPALVALGPLHADADADIRRILDGETRGKVKAEPVNAALLAVLKRLTQAAACRENTQGDPIRLLEVQAELREAAKQGRAAIARAEDLQAGAAPQPADRYLVPAMLSALRDAEAEIKAWRRWAKPGDGPERPIVTAMVLGKIEAAIARAEKATGQQPQDAPPIGLDEGKAPRPSVTFDIGGHAEGRVYANAEEAAADVAQYVRNLFSGEYACPEDHSLYFGFEEEDEAAEA